MSSTTSKGTYYKNKTRDYFQRLGYYVVLTEYKAAIPVGPGRTIWVTRDLLGADGVAMRKDTNEFILWNSKASGTKDSLRANKSKGRKDFSAFPFPDCVKRQIVLWEPRVAIPTIIDCP